MVKILDGLEVTTSLYNKLKEEYKNLVNKKKRRAMLVFILIGDDESSKIYLKNKEKKCNELGIDQKTIKLNLDIKEEKLIEIIKKLNSDKNVDGILLQMPIPKHLNYFKIASSINKIKDVDGFNPENIGNLFYDNTLHMPCTPSGIIEMLDYYNLDVLGKDVVIIGRSNIVGKPLSLSLINKGATVTCCNSKTKYLSKKTKEADILIVSAGVPDLIKSKDVKDGCIIIDVGINRVFGKIVGDVDFDDMINNHKNVYISKVPGGIGLMTIYKLMENTIKAFSLNT